MSGEGKRSAYASPRLSSTLPPIFAARDVGPGHDQTPVVFERIAADGFTQPATASRLITLGFPLLNRFVFSGIDRWQQNARQGLGTGSHSCAHRRPRHFWLPVPPCVPGLGDIGLCSAVSFTVSLQDARCTMHVTRRSLLCHQSVALAVIQFTDPAPVPRRRRRRQRRRRSMRCTYAWPRYAR